MLLIARIYLLLPNIHFYFNNFVKIIVSTVFSFHQIKNKLYFTRKFPL